MAIRMAIGISAAARAAALSLGLLLAPVAAGPAIAEPAALTSEQSAALKAYDNALKNFVSIMRQRRAQIDAGQSLPNLPGQAIYLARVEMMSTYKDLTDALPARIGRPNRLGIPPAYFDADNEPLLDEYKTLFDVMEAPPAGAQSSDTPFKDVVDLATVIARARGLDAADAAVAGRISLACSLPRRTASRMPEMRGRTPTRAACRPARPKIATARRSGPPSRGRSRPSILR